MIGRSGNFRIAIESLRSSKWRTMLTMSGVVIGVVSVVTIVSLGEGARHGVSSQIHKSGSDLITIRPDMKKNHGFNSRYIYGDNYGSSLAEKDLESIKKLEGVKKVVPFSFVTNTISRDGKVYNSITVIGTGEGLPNVLGQKLQYGKIFNNDDPQRNSAVIGQRVAEEVFGENVPIGSLFKIKGKTFIVQGIFEEFETSALSPNNDYNSTIFIQYDIGKELVENSEIFQILVRPKNSNNQHNLIKNIENDLYGNHGEQNDFMVQSQHDKQIEANRSLAIITSFVTSIAAISLVVGGIGILNIMLVSVAERTHEIGVRKAIGATNRQILNQFLTEAFLLSSFGGLIGIVFSLLINYLFRIFTNLTPIITWQIALIAFVVSVLVGITFGAAPALSAARKHPIDALRYE